MQWVWLILLFCSPLGAVTLVPGNDGARLEVTALSAEATLQATDAAPAVHYSCTISVFNPGAGGEFRLLARTSHGTEITVGGRRLAGESRPGGRTEWRINVPLQGRLTLVCNTGLVPRRLPHRHVLGLWGIELPLHRVRGFAAYPEVADISVHWRGWEAECFGAPQGTSRVDWQAPIELAPTVQTFEWKAHAAAERQAQLEAARAAVAEAKRTHDNREYTELLVSLAEVAELRADHTTVIEVCTEMERLEAAAGKAISHCGPWATWRSHVPWPLRRMRAQQAAGQEVAAPAEIVNSVEPLWEVYREVRGQPRPLKDFRPEKFGNYWDYDWPAVRELFATAVELAGDAERARAIRDGDE